MQSDPKTSGLLGQREQVGYWWAPGDPNDHVPGTLSYHPTNGLHLELLGCLTPFEQIGSAARAETQVIHGFTKAGRAVTLYGGFSFGPEFRAPGIITERFYSEKGLLGAYVSEPDAATFSSCAFRVSGLEEWLSTRAFSVTRRSLRPPYALDVAFRTPAETTYTVEHLNAQIRTALSFQTQGDLLQHYGITSQSWLTLAPDGERSLAWYIAAITKIRNLVALCFGAPVYVEGVTLLGPDPSAKQDRLTVEVLYAQNPSPPAEPAPLPHERIGLDDFGENAADILNAWFKLYDSVEPALDLFFAVLYGKSLYINIRFLLLAQAMEVLHRSAHPSSVYVCQSKYAEILRHVECAIPSDVPKELRDRISGILQWGNEYSLRGRLTELDSGRLTKIGVCRLNKHLRNKIVDTRNYYTHHGEDLKAKAAQGREMHNLMRVMSAAMSVILFDMLGVERRCIRKWMKQQREFSSLVF
jgi:hypothetical protein